MKTQTLTFAQAENRQKPLRPLRDSQIARSELDVFDWSRICHKSRGTLRNRQTRVSASIIYNIIEERLEFLVPLQDSFLGIRRRGFLVYGESVAPLRLELRGTPIRLYGQEPGLLCSGQILCAVSFPLNPR